MIELTLEQQEDIIKFAVPKSDMVKFVYEDIVNHKIDNWDEKVQELATDSLNGNVESFFNLLELIRLNSYNEGELNYAADQKGGS